MSVDRLTNVKGYLAGANVTFIPSVMSIRKLTFVSRIFPITFTGEYGFISHLFQYSVAGSQEKIELCLE